MAIDPLHPAPTSTPIMDKNGEMPDDWNRYFFNSFSTINAIAGVTNNSNILVNSTFNGQDGISTPITQSDGDGAYFAQLWQVSGASNADYEITSTEFTVTD